METKLRSANLMDVPLLQLWDRQPHVLAARNIIDPQDDWDWQTEIGRGVEWRELLIGEVDGRPVAFIQLIDTQNEETHYWGDAPPNQKAIDIWIGEAKDLGKGYGTALMKLAVNRCFANPDVDSVVIDPLTTNAAAIRFYRRLGFHFVEERMFGKDRCAVYEIGRYFL